MNTTATTSNNIPQDDYFQGEDTPENAGSPQTRSQHQFPGESASGNANSNQDRACYQPQSAEQPRLLLHACCGPCSLEPTRLLMERGFSPTIFYANSNIAPAEEYAQRGDTLRAWAASEGLPVAEGVYDSAAWEATAGVIGEAALQEVLEADSAAAVCSTTDNAATASIADSATSTRNADAGSTDQSDKPTSGSAPSREPLRAPILRIDPAKRQARCRACYRLRLEEAARYAVNHGFEALGTTLSVSVYQYTDIIQQELQRACAATDLTPVFEDFRPYFDEAERRSKELGMYRQNYCGCRFSDLEAQAERAERREARKAAKAAERAARADQTAAAEAEAQAKRAEKQAYAEKQRRKRELLKAMRNS